MNDRSCLFLPECLCFTPGSTLYQLCVPPEPWTEVHVPHTPVTTHLCLLPTPRAPSALRSQYTAGQKDGAMALRAWAAQQGNPATECKGGAGMGGALKGASCLRRTCWVLAQAGRHGKLGQSKRKLSVEKSTRKQLQLGARHAPSWSRFKLEHR